MTPAVVAAVQAYFQLDELPDELDNACEPSMSDPSIGKPISHTQLLAVSKALREHDKQELSVSYHLDELLRGSRTYYEPPKPKAEPTTEYKTLMARLRREEEGRAYERMINPPSPMETFEERFPGSAPVKLFQPSQADVGDSDEMTYADINRQVALIINILVSIVACSVAFWVAARHWNTPARLGLSMGGSGVIAVAEVVVYAGYLRRLKEAKERGEKHVEIKEIVKTWVIGGNDEKRTEEETIPIMSKAATAGAARRRNVQST